MFFFAHKFVLVLITLIDEEVFVQSDNVSDLFHSDPGGVGKHSLLKPSKQALKLQRHT